MARKAMPMAAAVTPCRMESRPSDAPTVSCCRYFSVAGSAPARRILASLVRLLDAEAPGDHAFRPDLGVDVGGGGHGAVQDDGQTAADVPPRLPLELIRAAGVEGELHVGRVGLGVHSPRARS